MNRTADGKIQPNRTKFPHGMKALRDYIHSLNLSYGIYTGRGNKTCGNQARHDD
jgi:hypothetical protein